jgi:hypothetical protein
MSAVAKGTFQVQIHPQAAPNTQDGVSLGRMSIAKRFEGDLVASGHGEMLTARTEVAGSAGYVAIERIAGTLHGRRGSFLLQHSGTMDKGRQQLIIGVVPDSGTGELVGLTGAVTLNVADGRHFYEFTYSLPPRTA